MFEDLGVSLRPRLGRAVLWTNRNPDNSVHWETRHRALPVTGPAEKWVVQLWFRRYRMFREVAQRVAGAPQAVTGVPVRPGDRLPDGVTHRLSD